jgi:molybdate transport system regulatory protein
LADDSLLAARLQIGGLEERFFVLLSAIQATGSINRAARVAGLSYKGAWLLLERASNLAQESLVIAATGGARGGGTKLTQTGHELLHVWNELNFEQQDFLATSEAKLRSHPTLGAFFGRMKMKSTARNQFVGTVAKVQAGPVSAEVVIRLKGEHEIVATMTAVAAKSLTLKKGIEAVALVKASSVILMTDFGGFQLSARNQLEGTVSRIDKGAVSSLVVLTLPGGTAVSATITNDALEALGLKIGQAATAVFKAYSVIVGVKK